VSVAFSDRDILDALSAGVMASAFDEIATYANSAACELLELTPEQCLGQPVPLLLGMTVSLDDQEFDLVESECRLDVELPCGPAGVTIRRVHGSGYVCVFRTKRHGRSADAALSRHEREVSISVLLSSFAHEARNPLATIQATLDTMHSELAGHEVAQHHLAVIERHLARLNDLVRNPMLAAQRSTVNRAWCHVRDIATSAVDAIAVDADRRRVALSLSVPDDLPPVLVDERAVRDALAELLENAVEASAAGAAVALSARVVLASGDPPDRRRVLVEIEDRGAGMQPREIAPALRAFSANKSGVTGHGLPRARNYIEQSGGRLAIESVPSVGTVVRVELPTEDQR
jgi:signal transduction histidine kinase